MKTRRSAILTTIITGLICGPPALADSQSEILVFVSADNLERQSVMDEALQNSDFTPTLDLLFAYNNGPWRILGEYYATDDEAELERFQVGYEFSVDTTFWLGRFHQPISVWGHRYHHGAYLQPSISRPSVENWEDENGVLPAHVTGLMFDGWQKLGENNGLRYAAAVGLAPLFEGLELKPYDILNPGEGGSRPAGSINISYFPDYVGETNFGLIGGYAEIEAPPDPMLGNETTIEIRQKVIGLHGNWESTDWRVIGAAYHVDNKSHGSNIQIGGSFVSAYLQVLYDLSSNTNLYGRVEQTRDFDTPYLSLFPLYVYQRELLGFRWDFAERQAFHLEVSGNRIVGDEYSEFRIQWSAVFP